MPSLESWGCVRGGADALAAPCRHFAGVQAFAGSPQRWQLAGSWPRSSILFFSSLYCSPFSVSDADCSAPSCPRLPSCAGFAPAGCSPLACRQLELGVGLCTYCAFHYRADGLRIRHSLQGNFPAVFPLLPQLVLLQMDNNRFK